MTPERWRQITQVFHAALAREGPARVPFLDEACAGDRSLRTEVDALLEAHDGAGSFGQHPIRAADESLPALDAAQDDSVSGSFRAAGAHIPASTQPARRHRFVLVVWVAAAAALVLFASRGWVLIQGEPVPAFGWEQAREGAGGWHVANVDPAGPAAGRLAPGDRLVEMSRAPVLSGRGMGPHRRALAAGDVYPITIERDGARHEHTLVVVSAPRALGEPLANFVIALVWCVVGCFIGFARPDLPHARLAFAGAVAVGVAFTPLGRVVHPLHVVLGYHFFSRFPAGRPVTGSAKWILVLLYAVAVVSVAPVWWREITQLVLGFPAVTAAVAANQWVFAFAALLRLWVFYLAIVAIVIVAVRNQRALRTEDQRRRMRWVAYGSSLALAPQIVWSVAEYVVSPAAAARLGLPANLISIGVPVVIAYAVVKHRMFDIRVVVRRGVQYLLARSALQCLLAVPVVALAYTVVVQRDRTIAELAAEGSGYLYWIVIAGLSLRFRQPIRLWLDRRFFREQHDVEQVLFAVVDDLGKAESIGHLSELVSTTVDSALHPTTVYVWYRDAGELAAASSSNPLLTPADLPAGGRWLSWLEAHGTGADLPVPADAGLSRRELQWFAARGICLAMPILDNGERLAGVVLLGPKKSDEPYGPGDRRLLQALTTQAGVVRETLRLRAQVTEDRRIRHDVLARLDRTHSTLLKECPVCGTCFDAAAERCERDGEPLTLTLPISRTVDDRYRLDRLIGKGGMGAVYEARDLRLERDVAVKVLAGRGFGGTPARRFHREARAVARLEHPHIVTVYDYGLIEAEGAYIVMERIEGRTLRATLEQDGALPPPRAIEWFDQLLDGLAAAHGQGIVHRDLKPENVIGRRDDGGRLHVTILDFGLAKIGRDSVASSAMTAAGMVMGTIGYMAPEQLLGGTVDQRTDIFAVGVMLAEALTGQRPFRGETYGDVSRAVLHDTYHLPCPSPETAALDAVVQQCLAKDAAGRFPSAASLRDALIPVLRRCGPVSGGGATVA